MGNKQIRKQSRYVCSFCEGMKVVETYDDDSKSYDIKEDMFDLEDGKVVYICPKCQMIIRAVANAQK